MIAWFRKRQIAKRVRYRMEFLGQVFDTIDAALIKNKVKEEERVKFWLKFIGDRSFRVKFIEDTMKAHER